MINRELFINDPLETSIANDGVARVKEPESDQEWDVLRHELKTFVCEGEYERGLERILSSYLHHLGEPTQPAVWISGFYGSGKSHLARMLEFLWRNKTFADGATARGLAKLPASVNEALKELTIAGRREGGLWSAAGTLGAGAADSVRLAFLGVIFKSAGLPSDLAPARFSLWLKKEGCYDAVKGGVKAAGRDFAHELSNMYVSPYLAASLNAAMPGIASSEAEVHKLMREQFPGVKDISDDDMIKRLGDVLEMVSSVPGKIPCTLIVLDELQQYIGNDGARALLVQNLVEACCSRFRSRVLFAATGQSALQQGTELQKLQGRFTVQVALSDTDVEKVVREVALRKKPDKTAAIEEKLKSCSGEIDRELNGTRIAPTDADRAVWVADYPLLPARRRFWEKTLRAVDKGGVAGQLRTQLRIVYEANRAVANEPLGTVVGADYIYEQLVPGMRGSGILLQEVEQIIKAQNDGSADGYLRERLCASIFLIGQLPTDAGVEIGVRATAQTLSDLLIQNLGTEGPDLRARIPGLLNALVEQGSLMQVGDEYRLQTRESAAWEQDFRGRQARLLADEGKIASDRLQALRSACDQTLKFSGFSQGALKVPRKIELHYRSDAPDAGAGGVPVWIRDEWSVSEKTVRGDAQAAGSDGPIVYVFIPQAGTAEAFKNALAALGAANETIQSRPSPSTQEANEAQRAMQTRRDEASHQVERLVAKSLAEARVFQGGGNEIVEDGLKSKVQTAAQASLARLYPHFNMADHIQWPQVVKRARDGSGDALAVVGFHGDVDKHPVCAAILTFIGSSGRKGVEIRKQFVGAPYGWSQDTVDGALLALTAADRLRAAQNGAPVTAKGLEQTRLGQVEFRVEGVTLTIAKRLGVRSLFQEAGVGFKANEEAQSVPAYLEALLTLARSAGGEPPLPALPSTDHVEALKALFGNEQLAALYDQKDRLSQEFKEWRRLKQAAEARVPRWQELQRLLKHAEQLPEHKPVAQQAEAILANRSLLAEPDPVPPLCDRLSDALRTAAQSERKRYLAAHTEQLSSLLDSGAWNSLSKADRDSIRDRYELGPEPELKVGTDRDLLSALDSRSLARWEERIAALPHRIARARLDAEKMTQPNTVPLELPHATLRTVDEVDQYLKDARELLLNAIKGGTGVVV
ncbi:MAG TPA: BREX system P-loop protein BrxC [Armatimonadota bacterium]|nr:BREX system P-loop protein BrxC [Armatimonadota bacterium]